jgi:hypothetical protein
MRKGKPFFGVLMSLFLMVFMDSGRPASASSSPDNGFQLYILKQDWNELSLGYEPDKAFSILETVMTDDCVFRIGLNEVAQYDWETQTIVLTQEASAAVILAVSNKIRHPRDDIAWMLYDRAFIVKYEGQFLYGGIFLTSYSQMGIQYPVAHVSLTKDKNVAMTLLPVQSARTPKEAPIPFTQWLQGRPTAEQLRFGKLILDARVKTAFADTGKLKE